MLIRALCLRFLIPILLFFSGFNTYAQASYEINRFNFSFDYQNFDTDWLSLGDRNMLAVGSELHLNEIFSVEAYYRQDRNGWVPYSHPYFGDDVYGLNPLYKWGTIGEDAYLGIRLYPYEQWHSSALELRKKYNTGFYVSFGTGVYQYEWKGYRIETFSSAIVDSSNGVINYQTDSAFIHRNGFRINQWGPQFGMGWKQFHTRYIYTDISIYTNAYMRDNRSVTGWYLNDERASNPPYRQEEWEVALDHVEYWAKNGHGWLFKASIGINLDIRK